MPKYKGGKKHEPPLPAADEAEIEPGEEVCPDCHLTFWRASGGCNSFECDGRRPCISS